MGWFSRFRHAWKAAGVQAPSEFIRATLASSFGITFNSLYDRLNVPQFDALERRYSSWVYACVLRNAQTTASVPLLIKQGKGAPDDPIVTAGPLFDLLDRPNPFQSRHAFIETLQMSMDIAGNAMIYVPQSPIGYPTEMWVLRPALTRPQRDAHELVTGWYYGFAPNDIELDYDEVIHLRMPYLSDPIFGLGPLQAALRTVDNDAMKETYHGALYANNARPDGILTYEGEQIVTNTQLDEIEERWKQKYGGPSKAGGVAVMAGGLKYQDVGITPRDSQLMDSMGWDRDKICDIFDNPSALHKTDDVNLANVKMAMFLYMRFGILPRCSRISDGLTHRLVPMFGDESVYIEFENPVPADEDFNLKKVDTAIKNRAITVNEYRAEMGWPPMEGQDELPEPPAPPVVAGDNADNAESDRTDPSKAATNGHNCNGHAKTNGEASRDAGEHYHGGKLKKMLTGFFERQQAAVVREINQHPPVPKSILATVKDEDPKFRFDRAAWDAILAKEAEPLITPIFIQAAERTIGELGGAFDVTNERAVAAVRRTVERFSRSVNATTATQVESAIRDAITEGQTMPDLTAKIGEIFGTAKTARAEAIARTETARAVTAGTDEGYAAAGVTEKEWLVSDDACPFCLAMTGVKVHVGGEFFKEGQTIEAGDQRMTLDYGDVDGPPLHPNCRCALVPVLAKSAHTNRLSSIEVQPCL